MTAPVEVIPVADLEELLDQDLCCETKFIDTPGGITRALCDEPAEYMVITSCCGRRELWCDQCLQEALWDATEFLDCDGCGHVFRDSSDAVLSSVAV